MASRCMALLCTILFTTLPWIAIPVNVNVAANGYLEVEREDGMRLNMSNESEMSKQRRSHSENPTVAGESVFANVYHLDEEVKWWNEKLAYVGIPGIYHVGIEAFGMEFSYGWCSGPGVYQNTAPKFHPVHVFYMSSLLGQTKLTKEDYIEHVEMFQRAPFYDGMNYNILRRNCISFSEHLIWTLPERLTLPWWSRFWWYTAWGIDVGVESGSAKAGVAWRNMMSYGSSTIKWLEACGYDVMEKMRRTEKESAAKRMRRFFRQS